MGKLPPGLSPLSLSLPLCRVGRQRRLILREWTIAGTHKASSMAAPYEQSDGADADGGCFYILEVR